MHVSIVGNNTDIEVKYMNKIGFYGGNKGFHYTFENGITVSVQFGAGNYCDNHSSNRGAEYGKEHVECPNAEVGIWNSNGGWITSEYEDNGAKVLPSKTPKEVLDILIWAELHK